MKFIAKSLMTWMAVLCIGLTCAGSARADWFEQVMDSWISISVVDGEPALEQVVGQISRARELAIVFDRRVDSSRPVQAELLQAGSLSGLLDTISAENRLEFESIGETLVVVPHSRAHRIRTLIALRQQEFRQQSAGISLSQRAAYQRRWNTPASPEWPLLTRPREMVEALAKEQGCELQGSELIPHDLWRAGKLHQVDAIDYLTWILFQYDLTFAWTKETVLTIVPVEDPVVIEKRHTLTTAQQKEAQEKFGARFSQATWVRQSERACQVTGPVELHQALGDWLVGKPEKTNTPKRIAWRDRRLTLEVKNKPLGEVLKFLTDAGLPLVYDLEELRKAGHLPEMLISFQVDQATADQVLKAICDPLKIPLKVTDEEIRLLPQD